MLRFCLILRPTVVKVDRVISLADLRRVLPKAVFQTRFSSEGDLFNVVEKLDFMLSVAVLNRMDLYLLNGIILFLSSVFLDGLYYSLCELVSSEVEQANTLNLLLQEIKAKDVVSFY